jgi:Na+/H+ antiporter NhaD/arsenite permease-like protein
MKIILEKMIFFFRAEAVLCIAAAAAIITMFFVPPSSHYLSYLNVRVLSLLFCLMVVVSGFQKIGIFLLMSEHLLKRVKSLRALTFLLVILCFIISMLVTNDVALITFVPFSILLLTLTGQKKYFIRVIVLETIAANLGSMLTPIGNPQNLYLYTHYNIPILEFLKITFPYAAASFVLLFIIILTTKKEPLSFQMPNRSENYRKNYRLLPVYTLQFLICIACVLRLFDYRIMLVAVLLSVLIFDLRVLKRVDYALLITFVSFFIFVGNIGNMTLVKDYFASLLIGKELPVAIISSQIISNVPAAILLSAFTDHYKTLIIGTNIGGLGSLVASLASLISYKFYCRTTDAQKGKYLRVFTLYNLLFLVGLCLFYRFGHNIMLVFLFLLIF